MTPPPIRPLEQLAHLRGLMRELQEILPRVTGLEEHVAPDLVPQLDRFLGLVEALVAADGLLPPER